MTPIEELEASLRAEFERGVSKGRQEMQDLVVHWLRNQKNAFSDTSALMKAANQIQGGALKGYKAEDPKPRKKVVPLTRAQCVEVRKRRKEGKLLREIAAEFGVSSGCISYIINGKTH